MIHPTAIVSPHAGIGSNVEVGAYSIIHDDVIIDDGTVISSHVVIHDGARIGKQVTIDSFTSIAGLPQDLSFDRDIKTYASIGDRTTVREGSTINRATKEGEATIIGEDCFLMAVSHLGHDCSIGNRVVIGNNSLLGGFVSVGDFAFLGGNSGIHQFCRIGKGVMFGGDSTATQDVPPFTMIAGRNALFGINLVGLRRRGVSQESIKSLKFCYSEIFGRSGSLKEIARELSSHPEANTVEAQDFLRFFNTSVYNRGFVRPHRENQVLK